MSVNKVMLVGRLGKDPEIRYMPNNDPVVTFSLATNESWKNKDGQRQEKAEWHNIVLFRSLANIAHQYLKKGSLVYIEGKIQSRKYLSKEGIERISYEIIADNLKMLGSKNDNVADNNLNNTASGNGKDYIKKVDDNTQANNIILDEAIEDLDDDIPF